MSRRGPAAAGVLLAVAVMISGCSDPAQTQAAVNAVLNGMICVKVAKDGVVAAASTQDADAMKALDAAAAAGGTVLSNAACQAAIANGAVLLASKPAPADATSPPTTAADPPPQK